MENRKYVLDSAVLVEREQPQRHIALIFQAYVAITEDLFVEFESCFSECR